MLAGVKELRGVDRSAEAIKDLQVDVVVRLRARVGND
jgi:hypothetical protein